MKELTPDEMVTMAHLTTLAARIDEDVQHISEEEEGLRVYGNLIKTNTIDSLNLSGCMKVADYVIKLLEAQRKELTLEMEELLK